MEFYTPKNSFVQINPAGSGTAYTPTGDIVYYSQGVGYDPDKFYGIVANCNGTIIQYDWGVSVVTGLEINPANIGNIQNWIYTNCTVFGFTNINQIEVTIDPFSLLEIKITNPNCAPIKLLTRHEFGGPNFDIDESDFAEIGDDGINIHDNNYEEDSCSCAEKVCLPVKDFTKLKFQINAILSENIPSSPANTPFDITKMWFISFCTSEEIPESFEKNTTLSLWQNNKAIFYDENVDLINTPVYTNKHIFSDPIELAQEFICDCKCFTFGIYLEYEDNGDTKLGLIGETNCFTCVSDDCFTSLIEYWSRENELGFTYESTNETPEELRNAIYLPFYIKQPQYNKEGKTYQRSDGVRIKLTASLSKEYDLETDWMGEEWHEKLAIALEHDFVRISSQNVNDEEFINDKDYKINWADAEPCNKIGKGSAKLIKSIYNAKNKYCKS